jgi:hypothetical protein
VEEVEYFESTVEQRVNYFSYIVAINRDKSPTAEQNIYDSLHLGKVNFGKELSL